MAFSFESSIVLTNAACNLVFASTTSYITESSAGQIDIYANSVNVMTLTSSGMALTTGAFVDTIETTLTDDDTHIPTSGAVTAAIGSSGTSPWKVASNVITPLVLGDDVRLSSTEQLQFIDANTYIYSHSSGSITVYLDSKISFRFYEPGGGGFAGHASYNNFHPAATDTYDLGQSTGGNWWQNVYAQKYFVDDASAYIDYSGTELQFTDGVTGMKTLAELGGLWTDETTYILAPSGYSARTEGNGEGFFVDSTTQTGIEAVNTGSMSIYASGTEVARADHNGPYLMAFTEMKIQNNDSPGPKLTLSGWLQTYISTGASSVTGNLHVTTGDADTTDSGQLYLYTGSAVGTKGTIYFGDSTASSCPLSENASATHVVSLDTSTGLLKYTAVGDIGGSSVDFGAATYIPYMQTDATNFDYSSSLVWTGTKLDVTGQLGISSDVDLAGFVGIGANALATHQLYVLNNHATNYTASFSNTNAGGSVLTLVSGDEGTHDVFQIGNSLATIFRVTGDGYCYVASQLHITDYGNGTVTGTATYGLAVDTDGKVVEVSLSGSGVSFGDTNQIPHMNTGTPGTDFDYSSNLTFTGTVLSIGGSTTTSQVSLDTTSTYSWWMKATTSTNLTWGYYNLTFLTLTSSSLTLDSDASNVNLYLQSASTSDSIVNFRQDSTTKAMIGWDHSTTDLVLQYGSTFGANGRFVMANGYLMYFYGTTSAGIFIQAATAEARLYVNAATGYDSQIYLRENNVTQTIMGYDAGINAFQIHTGTAFTSLAAADFSIGYSTGYVYMGNLRSVNNTPTLRHNTGTGEITYYSSDRRLKKNIREFDIDALDTLSKFEPRTFEWNEFEGTSHGWIAQEGVDHILNMFPMVKKTGLYAISETEILPYYHKAIMQLKAEIEELKKQLK